MKIAKIYIIGKLRISASILDIQISYFEQFIISKYDDELKSSIQKGPHFFDRPSPHNQAYVGQKNADWKKVYFW